MIKVSFGPRLELRFRMLRAALAEGVLEEVACELELVEQAVGDELERLGRESAATADANARSVMLLDEHEEQARELRRRMGEFEARARELEAERVDLESRCAAISAANVESVFMLDESEARSIESAGALERLARVREELEARSRELEGQALSLAEANTEAIVLLEEHEQRIAELARRAEAEGERARELEEKAIRDALTGLHNHRHFKEQLERELARVKRYDRRFSLVLFDIDHFKQINDTHGHLAGDAVLREIGRLLAQSVRDADLALSLPVPALPARYGGEEFVLLLPETELPGAVIAAERIRRQIETSDFFDGAGRPLPRVTVSCGVDAVRFDDLSGVEIVRRADRALYAAKHRGRNRVELDPGPEGAANISAA